MTYQNILVETKGRVGIIRLNRPQALNALNAALIKELTAAVDSFDADLNIGCILIPGNEKAFAAGADIKEMADKSYIEAFLKNFGANEDAIARARKPTVAAVAGFALGGGCEYAMQCDVIIAADNAKLIQVFIRRGLVPDAGVAYLLPRIVGMHKAKELIFFGDDLSAADAAALGIVNKVVPAADLQSATKEWAERLASGPTKAIGWSKKLLHDASELSRRDLLEEEAMLVELNSSTVDSQEGVASFRERRAPEWKGW